MILNIINEVSEYFQSNISEVNSIKRYKNEFEENGNWVADFPCILWRIQSIVPTAFFANGEASRRELQLKLYIGDKKTDEASALRLIEIICDKANGVYLTSYDFRILLKTGAINYHMYNNGVEIYIMEMSIEFWKE